MGNSVRNCDRNCVRSDAERYMLAMLRGKLMV